MNTIWALGMAIGILFAVVNGRLEEFTKAMFEVGKAAVEVCLYLVGIVSLWLGVTKILEESGLMETLRGFSSRPWRSCSADYPPDIRPSPP